MIRTTALAATLSLATGIFGSALAAETITLRYSNWLPLGYPVNSDILLPWADRVAEVTEGRVVVEPTPMVVGSVAGQFDVIADGLADLALFTPAWTPGRFPLVDGLELPFQGDNPRTLLPAAWRTYETFLQSMNLFEGVEVLGLMPGNAAHTFMAGRVINSLADYDGARIRIPSPTAGRTVALLGAVPVQRPATETYELASAGIIDGAVVPIDSAVGFHLHEVLQQMSYLPGGLVNTVNVWAINPAKWNQISEVDRAAIREISGEAMSRLAGEAYAALNTASLEAILEAGVTVHRPEEAAVAEIVAAVEPIRAAWIEGARAHGLEDPQAMLDFLRSEIEVEEAAN